MKIKTKEEKASSFLFGVCFIVYILVCMTKTNYSASIAHIVSEGIFSKSDAGIIASAFYITYGLGQMLGGGLTDRLSPFTVMAIGLVGSIITNIALMFTNNFWCVLVLWSLTGLAQFGVWPAAARIVAGVLVPSQRKKASVNITLGISGGGIMSYIVVTPVLENFGWLGVFAMNSIVLIVSLILWYVAQKKTENILSYEKPAINSSDSAYHSDKEFLPLMWKSGLVLILLISLSRSLMDNCVKSWVPTLMVEMYGISSVWASIQTAAVFVCNMLGLFLLVRIFGRIKNAVLTQLIYFLIYLPASVLMQFVGKIPLWMMVALLMISTTVIYATTNISVRIAVAFDKYGYSGRVSAIINAIACFGVVIGNAGYGIIAENFGWSVVTALWVVFCVLAIALSIPAVILWKKFMHENK